MAFDKAGFEAAMQVAVQGVANQFQAQADVVVKASPIAVEEDDFEVKVSAIPIPPVV